MRIKIALRNIDNPPRRQSNECGGIFGTVHELLQNVKQHFFPDSCPVFFTYCDAIDMETNTLKWTTLERLGKIAVKMSLGLDPIPLNAEPGGRYKVRFEHKDAEGDWVLLHLETLCLLAIQAEKTGKSVKVFVSAEQRYDPVKKVVKKAAPEAKTDSAKKSTKAVSAAQTAIIESTKTVKKLDGVLLSFVEVVSAATFAVTTQVKRMEAAAAAAAAAEESNKKAVIQDLHEPCSLVRNLPANGDWLHGLSPNTKPEADANTPSIVEAFMPPDTAVGKEWEGNDEGWNMLEEK